MKTTSSSPPTLGAAALFALLTTEPSSALSGCGRLAGVISATVTSTTVSFCCVVPFSRLWLLAASGRGDFLGLVGILTSPDAPLMGLSCGRGSLLGEGLATEE